MSGSGSAASAIRRGRTARSVSSIFPSLLPNQRHEAHAAQILLDELAIGTLGHLDQLLHPARLADRHDDAPAVGELLDPRLGHVAAAGGGDDRIERSLVETALRPVALDNLEVVVAEAVNALPRELDQVVLPLDADHF